MNKVLIILKREYLTRVKKKMFLVTTILIPAMFLGLSILIGYMAAQNNSTDKIIVQDQTQYFQHKLDTTSSAKIVYANPQNNESNKDFLTRLDGDVLLHIYPFHDNKLDSVVVYSEEGLSLTTKSFIEDQLNDLYAVKQMEDAGIDKTQIDSINSSEILIKTYSLKDNNETNTELAMAFGGGIGVLMYLIILLYGNAVMTGVMEEKTNRIAEVIISSVKPFQLMLGKIIGIGLVSLTQLLLWLVLMGGLRFLLPLIFPDLPIGFSTGTAAIPPEAQQEAMKTMADHKDSIFTAIGNLPIVTMIVCFFIYFLGGYFIYAAMFAAVGSLVNEDPQEARQLQFPITMPIIFSYFILMSTIKDPNGPLAVFGSMFPLTSPIVMMARIPYGVPIEQIILSITFLIVGFLLLTWISAKIYRIGILMYGKKATWKEIFKWLRYS